MLKGFKQFLLRGNVIDLAVAERNAPPVSLVQAGEKTKEGALAAAAASDDGEELTRRSVQIEGVQHDLVAEALNQPARGERSAWRGVVAKPYFEARQCLGGRQSGNSRHNFLYAGCQGRQTRSRKRATKSANLPSSA